MAKSIGRLGCHLNGKTVIVPITYAFDGRRLIAHAGEGEKIEFMRANPFVCFEVDEIKDVHNWRTVIVQGKYHELEGGDASVAISYLVEKVLPELPPSVLGAKGGISLRPQRTSVSDSIVFSLEILNMSGRYEST